MSRTTPKSQNLEKNGCELAVQLAVQLAAQGWCSECLLDPPHFREILEGSFSAVSTPNFAMKASFESSRRDLHNTHHLTNLRPVRR